MALPTSARVTQEFGSNFIVNGQWAYPPGGHNGMDFGARSQAIFSPYAGTVDYVGWDSSGYGNLLIIKDVLGYRHWLAHLSGFLVSKGQGVGIGQQVAISGNTGFSTAPHLHWGVQLPGYSGYNGYVNPRNWPGFNTQGATIDPTIKRIAVENFIYRLTGILHPNDDIDRNHINNTFEQLAHKFFVTNPQELLSQYDKAYRLVYGPPASAADDAQRKKDYEVHRAAGKTYWEVLLEIAGNARKSGDTSGPKLAEAKAKAQEIVNL